MNHNRPGKTWLGSFQLSLLSLSRLSFSHIQYNIQRQIWVKIARRKEASSKGNSQIYIHNIHPSEVTPAHVRLSISMALPLFTFLSKRHFRLSDRTFPYKNLFSKGSSKRTLLAHLWIGIASRDMHSYWLSFQVKAAKLLKISMGICLILKQWLFESIVALQIPCSLPNVL